MVSLRNRLPNSPPKARMVHSSFTIKRSLREVSVRERCVRSSKTEARATIDEELRLCLSEQSAGSASRLRV